MATHSSILAWEIPQTEKPGGLWSMSYKELDMTQQVNNNKLYPLYCSWCWGWSQKWQKQKKKTEQMIIIKLIAKGRVRGHYM